MMEFQYTLKRLRESKGIDRNEMANYLQMTPAAYAFYEQGRRQPTLDKLLLIAQKLSCSVDYLLGNNISSFEQMKNQLQEMGIKVTKDNDSIALMSAENNFMVRYLNVTEEEFTSRMADILAAVDQALLQEKRVMVCYRAQQDVISLLAKDLLKKGNLSDDLLPDAERFIRDYLQGKEE